jgi:putative DNA primase/helicase
MITCQGKLYSQLTLPQQVIRRHDPLAEVGPPCGELPMTIISDGVHNELTRDPMLLAAVSFARSGTPIFPCHPRSKQPLSKHGFYNATTDQAIIHDWWTRWPDAMIGMPTGMVTEMFVVDLDTKGDGIQHFAALCEQHGGVPITRTATTSSGGRHLYFRYPQDRDIRNSAGKLGRGIDVRGKGGYVIVAPSRRHDGATYSWDTSGKDVGIAQAPRWLLDLIDPPAAPAEVRPTNDKGQARWAQAALHSELGRVLSASEGTRNDTLVRASCALGQIVAGDALTHEEVFGRLLNVALAVGLGRGEAEGTIASGMKAGATQPRQRPASGSGDRHAEPIAGLRTLPLLPASLPPEDPYTLRRLARSLRAAQAIGRTVQVLMPIARSGRTRCASLLLRKPSPMSECPTTVMSVPYPLQPLYRASWTGRVRLITRPSSQFARYEQELRDVYERRCASGGLRRLLGLLKSARLK